MTVKLASAFPQRKEDTWRASVDEGSSSALNKLRTQTDHGDWIEPLYSTPPPSLTDEKPGYPPYTRGFNVNGLRSGWKVRQRYQHPDLSEANRHILRDLSRGITDISLVFDEPTNRGLDPDSPEASNSMGSGGLPLASVDDLDLGLAGVLEQLAPLSIYGGVSFAAQAALVIGFWKRREAELKTIQGSLGAAPLSAWAQSGFLPYSLETAWSDLADLAKWCSKNTPQVYVARANEHPFHNSGASDADGLACILSETVATLRAFHESGHPLGLGIGQLEIEVALTPDVFEGISKLRALRLLLSKVFETLNIPEPPKRPQIVAGLAYRSMTKYDPWVNLLRGTSSTFAAAIGAADIVALEPFDRLLGHSEELGLRLARNTPLILDMESHLTQVIDPAGGSWYIEHRTQQLAASAWAAFQEFEVQGGLASAFNSGWLQDRIAQTHSRRQDKFAHREQSITGISAFPDQNESPVELASPNLSQIGTHLAARLKLSRDVASELPSLAAAPDRISKVIEAAEAGATLAQIQTALYGVSPSGETCVPLPLRRTAEPFENLRQRTQSQSPPPVFLANIGPLARHTTRATFVQNLVAIGGWQVTHGPATSSSEVMIEAFSKSKARVAVICGADEDYASHAESYTAALKAAGAQAIYLAGRPPDYTDKLQARGLKGFWFMGQNVEDVLQDLLLVHGLSPSAGDEP